MVVRRSRVVSRFRVFSFIFVWKLVRFRVSFEW